MISRETIEIEVALDEGSRATLGGKDPISIVGCVILLGAARDKARELITARSVPKWKNAGVTDVETVLSVFESTRAVALVRLFDRTQDGVRRMKETIEGAIRREADVLENAHLFLDKPSTIDKSPEGLYHLMLFGSVSPLLHKAAVEEVARSYPKKYYDLVEVEFSVFIDKYDAHASHLGAVRGAFSRYAGASHITYQSLPRIRYAFRGADFAEETERASLIIVDHLSGIVASQTVPNYRLPRKLERAAAIEWYERLSKHPRMTILRKPIESLLPEVLAAEAQGQDLAMRARELKADVLREHPPK